MSSDTVEILAEKPKGYKAFKERQAEAALKIAAKEAQKTETPAEKSERLDREAADRRVKAAKGSEAYAFTPTGGAKKGQGRTIINPPAVGRLGKAGRVKAAKQEKERVREARVRRKEQAR